MATSTTPLASEYPLLGLFWGRAGPTRCQFGSGQPYPTAIGRRWHLRRPEPETVGLLRAAHGQGIVRANAPRAQSRLIEGRCRSPWRPAAANPMQPIRRPSARASQGRGAAKLWQAHNRHGSLRPFVLWLMVVSGWFGGGVRAQSSSDGDRGRDCSCGGDIRRKQRLCRDARRGRCSPGGRNGRRDVEGILPMRARSDVRPRRMLGEADVLAQLPRRDFLLSPLRRLRSVRRDRILGRLHLHRLGTAAALTASASFARC